ncbi:ABC transporter ATP-binding protein [Clostridium estertheticum]|uniref:ABC transporter ATP-binding protein n=1 Tax=Clostridium estertheticum TaxID=238834 RepID=A0A7Y3WTZ0_9CLOT|nr:ABC transporter ATP-binding protein [Clostridium estertheticum]MBW9173853.1 ABC transporter ATP-binding protein/permease [Clostridium estertheticum]NNU78717.1 ABC transporter ATP-binding protein [Clostridium estertheticum]WBL49590.1 ABC transporter ATP-binding protein/permease [Clostridium estertheticum]WLC77780.1 ABC transporter ATP-binding protein/permease [Clostridium estertheticum]
MNKVNNEHVSFKDIVKTIKMIPKIFTLISNMDKKSFVIIIALSLIIGLTPILSLFTSQYLLNMIYKKNFYLVMVAFICYFFVSAFDDFISNIKGYYEFKFESVISYNINVKVMNKCSKLSLKDFENSEIYDKLQRVQEQVAFKPYQVFQSIIQLITAIVTLVSAITILINWKPWVLIVLLIVPAIFSLYFIKISQREFNVEYGRSKERRKSWYLSYILTKDSTFKEIKLYNLSTYILNKFKDINKTFIKQDIKLFKRRSIFTLSFGFIEQICTSSILLIIIYSALLNKMLIGNVVGFIKAISLTESNTKSIINTMYSLYKNNLYINQLFEFLALPEEQSNNTLIGNNIDFIENIKIKNLTFKYPTASKEVLKNINLDIKKGERIAIVGQNGSGKSTLVKLLLKLYNTDNDSIFYNNKSINHYNTEQMQSCIGVLFQDFIKYELTLKENVGFGNIEKINEKHEMRGALEKAQVNFIDDLDAQLGLWFDDGIQFSGGQWQKIALARAFFRNASLYVLDEPSSALDPIAEKQIIDMFIEMTKDKIGIFISHRLSTAMLADKIVVMDKGRISGVGTHDVLLKTNAIYKEMYELETIKDINLAS